MQFMNKATDVLSKSAVKIFSETNYRAVIKNVLRFKINK
ncbi:hypothetical protein PSPO_a1860 [Pseudoalteromonas spongiae UST010723-006]|nr:hypothetical protein PSPO_a1860 [Pseudoalteromonas spongiae UST010723-006]